MPSVACRKTFSINIPIVGALDWSNMVWTILGITTSDGEGGAASSSGSLSGGNGNWDTLNSRPDVGQHSHNYTSDVNSTAAYFNRYTGPAQNANLHIQWTATGSHNPLGTPGGSAFTIEILYEFAQIVYYTNGGENASGSIDIPFTIPNSFLGNIWINFGQNSSCGMTPEQWPGFWIDAGATVQLNVQFSITNI